MDFAVEAEYVVACDATKEDIWIQKFCFKGQCGSSIELAIPLYQDNIGVIAQVKEPRSH